MRTDVGDKVFFQKNPRPSDFDAGDQALLGTLAQFFLVDVQEGAGLEKVQGVHLMAS